VPDRVRDVLNCVAVNATSDDLVSLYESTVDGVYRYASRLTGGDRARTDDLVQDTYLGVLRRIQRGERLELSAGYLIVACRSRFLDELKANRRRTDRELRVGPGTQVIPSEADPPSATAALARLPDDQRAAMVLRYVDDLTVADVAHHLGRSVRATESLLVRGRAALRTLLQEGDPS
jgi:RNA polymerase sigma-70 factor (ECF subfamily)